MDRTTSNLPRQFDVKAMEAKRQPNVLFCQLCEDKFVLIKNPIRHCKRCAKAVCKVCSENRRQLSQLD